MCERIYSSAGLPPLRHIRGNLVVKSLSDCFVPPLGTDFIILCLLQPSLLLATESLVALTRIQVRNCCTLILFYAIVISRDYSGGLYVHGNVQLPPHCRVPLVTAATQFFLFVVPLCGIFPCVMLGGIIESLCCHFCCLRKHWV